MTRLHVPNVEGLDHPVNRRFEMFDFLRFHATDDTVFAFLVVNDLPVTLSDPKGLFPSDAFITQLRLLIK